MLADAIATRVAQLYGAEGEHGCPGEENCETWKSSAPDQPDEARCPSCPKRSKVPGVESQESGTDDETADHVQQLVRERDSGREIFFELTPIEWELVKVWDDNVAAFERGNQIQIAQLFQLVAGMVMARHGG